MYLLVLNYVLNYSFILIAIKCDNLTKVRQDFSKTMYTFVGDIIHRTVDF